MVELVKHLAEQGGTTHCRIAADCLGVKHTTVERLVTKLANRGLVVWLSYGMDYGSKYSELSLTRGMAREVHRYGAEFTMDMVDGGAAIDPDNDDAVRAFGAGCLSC